MRIDYFQLIDRIVAFDPAARTISTEALVPRESTIFEGHFPGFPIMPGVLLIEAMAQTAGWLIIALTQFERMPFLAAVKDAKLRTFVSPGELLSLTAELVHQGSGYAVADARATMGKKAVCNAQITFRIVDFPGPDFRAHMEAMADRLEFPRRALVNDRG